MAVNRTTVADQRNDISRFVVHLTRDDSADFSEGGATARDNFKSIIDGRCVHAFRSHCLHNPRLKRLPDDKKEEFNVACFTETPLHQIHLLTQQIQGRNIRFEPYGLVFTKSFLISNGAQPALYINGYGGNNHVKVAVDEILNVAIDNGFKSAIWRILPFINVMYEKYDFAWEREWRVRKGLRFKLTDLVCVILPADGDDDLKDRFLKAGLSYISPGWTYERIVNELASQQRATRKLTFPGPQLMIKKNTSKR